ncbi:Phosphate-import permease protein PhnE [Marinomonas spartinae]|uniref:Phosphate-import permease protein PhnE n=1 Tax=Marinomonas spartinae TaxID=1792290 RepID=A0A1A8TK50_9GAMM|nr:phosphonate ABC transporter, permease protein PhnE [Marinomonas spartinae]SBS34215.1 Phosphate-import permease protein PhnE [Marinomonas spartinae]SBS37660.1 Phosphate-import permease protein PhnE [Marinomonas spartinae]
MPSQTFESYYQSIRQRQKRESLLWSIGILIVYFYSGYLSEFSLSVVWQGIPHFFDYLSDILPTLHLPVLFADGHTKGSFAYWGYRLNIQIPLLGQTIAIAIAATLFSSLMATFASFPASNNTQIHWSLRYGLRSIAAFCRTMPELAWAVMFVMAFGVGPIPGFFALFLHSFGCQTKLFYETVEVASDKPVRGLRALGASRLMRMRYGLWPQVAPTFMSYTFMRLETNFRQSTILGLVGGGGIGQELMTSIKLDHYDQVSIVLIQIILVVSLLDFISGKLRHRLLKEMSV